MKACPFAEGFFKAEPSRTVSAVCTLVFLETARRLIKNATSNLDVRIILEAPTIRQLSAVIIEAVLSQIEVVPGPHRPGMHSMRAILF
jgi:hypothetical protein